jgi:hypothetical protein
VLLSDVKAEFARRLPGLVGGKARRRGGAGQAGAAAERAATASSRTAAS